MARVRHRQGWTGQMIQRLSSSAFGSRATVLVIQDGNGHSRKCKESELTTIQPTQKHL